jgi:hypothetical protein
VFPAGEAEFQSAADDHAERTDAGRVPHEHHPDPRWPISSPRSTRTSQGNAILIENSSNGPDLANNFESEYEGTGFVSHALGSVNAQVTALVQKASIRSRPRCKARTCRTASAIVMSQGLEIPIAFIPEIVAYNKTRVGGKVVAPIGYCKANLAGIYIKK